MLSRSLVIFLRLLGVMGVCLEATLRYYFTIKWTGKAHSYEARSHWLHITARHMAWVLNIQASYEGKPPREGVMVSNHISYIDIIVHAARTPLVFISKAEVENWPVFGPLTRWAGTLFIRRELRKDVRRVADKIPGVVESGNVLTFFPEGTSSDGNGLLPFRPSLLAPIVEHGWKVTPAFIRYTLEPGDGTVEDDVAYYRPDTVFGLHLFRLLGRRRIFAKITYGSPVEPGADRKELALYLRESICELGGLEAAAGSGAEESV
jgi:lyso-ornithine lipid O-acyltransferase